MSHHQAIAEVGDVFVEARSVYETRYFLFGLIQVRDIGAHVTLWADRPEVDDLDSNLKRFSKAFCSIPFIGLICPLIGAIQRVIDSQRLWRDFQQVTAEIDIANSYFDEYGNHITTTHEQCTGTAHCRQFAKPWISVFFVTSGGAIEEGLPIPRAIRSVADVTLDGRTVQLVTWEGEFEPTGP